MSQYLFQNPKPFIEPLRYDYADVDSTDFIKSWRFSRQQFLNQLQFCEGVQNIEEDASGNFLSLLSDIAERKDYALLLRFVKKFEVFGRLYASYDGFYKKTNKAGAATLEHYIMFANLLIQAAQDNNNLQYLSSLLKLCDNFCSLKTESLTASQTLKIMQILEQENILIQTLQERL